ncbi:hypothetical protein ACUR5C_12940 [Aliikangiella sp. IMCC44653]
MEHFKKAHKEKSARIEQLEKEKLEIPKAGGKAQQRKKQIWQEFIDKCVNEEMSKFPNLDETSLTKRVTQKCLEAEHLGQIKNDKGEPISFPQTTIRAKVSESLKKLK